MAEKKWAENAIKQEIPRCELFDSTKQIYLQNA